MPENRASPAPLVYARPPLDARAYGRDLEQPPHRVIVVDDGSAPRLAVYAGAELIAAVPLDPGRALRLAEKLILVARQAIEAPAA